MRHTKGHRNNRRQHLKLREVSVSLCPKCKSPVIPHALCYNCGTYRGKQIIDVLKKLTKRERKQKEKELQGHESGAASGEAVGLEELSRK